MREKKLKTDAPTKDAVAAEAMADTENSVPMLSIVPASSIVVSMLWFACSTEQRICQSTGLGTVQWKPPKRGNTCEKPRVPFKQTCNWRSISDGALWWTDTAAHGWAVQ